MVTWPASTAAFTLSASAWKIWRCLTTATGALSQAPTQGAWMTRTSGPRIDLSCAVRAPDPFISQVIESQTRTVRAGGASSPCFTTSKW